MKNADFKIFRHFCETWGQRMIYSSNTMKGKTIIRIKEICSNDFWRTHMYIKLCMFSSSVSIQPHRECPIAVNAYLATNSATMAYITLPSILFILALYLQQWFMYSKRNMVKIMTPTSWYVPLKLVMKSPCRPRGLPTS